MKATAKHARSPGVHGWVARLPAGGFAGMHQHRGSPLKVPPGRVRADPFAGPVALTERAVIGDQLRRPVVWCEIASCVSRYEDRAAFGEADIRARAIGAGWRHDGVGRLACPDCQQRSPDVWATSPVVPRKPAPQRGKTAGHARPSRLLAAWSAVKAWYRDFQRGRDRRTWSPDLLAALANGANGWNAPPWDPVSNPPGRLRHAEGAASRRPAQHRAARHVAPEPLPDPAPTVPEDHPGAHPGPVPPGGERPNDQPPEEWLVAQAAHRDGCWRALPPQPAQQARRYE
jgi:hypothetical protein